MEHRYKGRILNEETPLRSQETLRTLIETLINPECFKRDLFFASLLIAMKDNEFLLLKKIGETMNIVEYIVTNRTLNETAYEAMFILSGFPELPIKIIACPLNEVILIIATIPQMYKETYSVCFKINKYIVTSDLGIPVNFVNLTELILVFKEKIIIPVKSVILNYHKYPSGNLSGLPDDVIYQIFLYLPINDILNLSESCKKLQKLVNEENLIWFKLHRRDFPDRQVVDAKDWHDIYKDMYILQQDEKHRNARIQRAETSESFGAPTDYNIRQVDSRWEVIL